MLTIFGLALLMCSCAPNFYYLPLQKMTKSEYGHTLVGKSLAIVFADTSFFMSEYARAFAGFLQEDYKADVQYFVANSLDNTLTQKQQMVEFATLTGGDIVFFLVAAKAKRKGTNVTLSAHTIVYDTFSKRDTTYVYPITYTTTSKESLMIKNEETAQVARDFAEQATSRFQPRYTTDEVPFAYRIDNERWLKPLEEIAKMNIPEAVELWTAMLNTKDKVVKGAVELNIA